MRLLGSVILGERADVSVVLLRALLGQEAQRTIAGCLELTVRHDSSGPKASLAVGGAECSIVSDHVSPCIIDEKHMKSCP